MGNRVLFILQDGIGREGGGDFCAFEFARVFVRRDARKLIITLRTSGLPSSVLLNAPEFRGMVPYLLPEFFRVTKSACNSNLLFGKGVFYPAIIRSHRRTKPIEIGCRIDPAICQLPSLNFTIYLVELKGAAFRAYFEPYRTLTNDKVAKEAGRQIKY